ncbi:efflux RND transporter periplasmic adaptor subunit [Mesorhizobium sp. BH1-1-5]|uniref:HlyD family secretion protein n=1 Tax=Mesorhizobium sp. BH1-1-5 TaxID=2876661 RepID=UPI001CCFA90A|nr:efflux RND transporter periplasmic adaptor subunit [Mesorhizobium sp. BH1-1-5]MBZ9988165.1 efflux RND transporter periplasmic adaptor subunit [Mesorhizobium sp. BH1-1-5]
MARVLRILIGLGCLGGLGVLLWFATLPPPLVIQGEVSADRVDVSPRVSGRVVQLNFDVGDIVKRGDILTMLESPELLAAMHSTEAALSVAEADLMRVNSTRFEVIAARKAEVKAASADVLLYQADQERQAKLVATGASPQARADESNRNLEAALRSREAAQANLDLATAGASKEERSLAAAKVEQAKATLNQQQTDLKELTVFAPIDGQVTTRVAEMGENFSAGSPLFSIIDVDHPWFTFNMREDLLKGLHVGETFQVTVPALKNAAIDVKVTVINAQGQYATWRATRATGDFDLRTFEVRASPVSAVVGLRPGMSAIASWPRAEQ